MTSAPSSGTLVTILPCNDLDASERFYNRLGPRARDRAAGVAMVTCTAYLVTGRFRKMKVRKCP